MTKRFNFLIKITAILVFFLSLFQFLTAKTQNDADAQSGSSEIVMEVSSKRVLHESNAHVKKFMASTTKILTAITIIENCDVNALVTVSAKTVGVEGSSIYLREGEKLTVKELLYGLMLRSGNDCAETLAVFCSGSIQKFAELMNKTARKTGAVNSNFVNPHGLHDDNHYTTAYDLALISCYAMQNTTFRDIVGTKIIKISNGDMDYPRVLVNKNKMLKEFEGATGIKTGFTKKAGRCLVSSAIKDNLETVCVVLNCPPMFERSKELLNSAFNNYSKHNLVKSDEIIDFIDVVGSSEKCGICVKNDVSLPLTKKEKENLKIVYDYPKIIEKGVKCDQPIGKIKFYTEKELIFEEKIYTITEVN